MKKVIITNIILFFAAVLTKVLFFINFSKWSQIFSKTGGGKVSNSFLNIFLYQHEDVIIVVSDYTIYVIIIGIIINLYFLFTNKEHLS